MTIPPETTTKPCLADQLLAEHEAEYARFKADLAGLAVIAVTILGLGLVLALPLALAVLS